MARRRRSEGATLDNIASVAPPPRNPRAEAMAKVAEKFKAFRPAREVLRRVRAVPTIFPQFDFATRVGGMPIERFAVVHGPSNHGKTMFVHGLGLSFLQRGHYYAYIDAENTTPISWLDHMMGSHASNPAFVALRPESYEQTADAVRNFVTQIAEARERGLIPEETSALIVVDSIRKLVPKKLLATVMAGEKGIDGMGGRAAQIKAALNAAWLDELTPLLYKTGTAMIAIAREAENPNAGIYEQDWKMTGGKALEYDSSLVLRITRSWVKDGKGDDAAVVGEKHVVTIRKTKVAGKDDKAARCNFYTSNGVLIPEGFDPARDVLELARKFDIVKTSGAWLTWKGKRWQGEGAAIRKLSADAVHLAMLEAQVREKFDQFEADKVADGGA